MTKLRCASILSLCGLVILASGEPLTYRPGSGYHLCPDQLEVCPDHLQCCLLATNKYGCCQKSSAPEQSRLDLIDVEDIQPQPNRILCPASHETCPNGYTCCQVGILLYEYQCCPYPHAVCCSDGKHCCPSGMLCDPKAKRCRTPDLEEASLSASSRFRAVDRSEESINLESTALESQRQLSDVKDPNVICLDGKVCLGPSTCCRQGSYYACCNRPNAVCCSDGLQCCPTGSICVTSTHTCIRPDGTPISDLMIYLTAARLPRQPTADVAIVATQVLQKPLAADESNVVCRDGSHCPSGNTCCEDRREKSFACCPLPNAVCCTDGGHCCPNGFLCSPESDICHQGATLHFLALVAAEKPSETL